jgi:hypothetical protein
MAIRTFARFKKSRFGARMLLLFKVLPIQRINQLVSYFWSFLFLEILDDTVGVQGVGYGAAEFIVDACGGAVCGHECCVHFHFFFGVAISIFVSWM